MIQEDEILSAEISTENIDEKRFTLTFTYASSTEGTKLGASAGYMHQYRANNKKIRRWFKAGLSYSTNSGNTGIDGEIDFGRQVIDRSKDGMSVQICKFQKKI